MSYVQPHDSGRRFTGMIAVLVLHILLVYGLVNGLARKMVQVITDPLETKIIEEVKPPEDKPPPPPPPKFAPPPPPYIPPPEVQVQLPASMQQYAITAVTSNKPAPAPVVVAPRQITRHAAIVNASACEKPEYPSAALRAQEEGVVTLGFLIDVDFDGTILWNGAVMAGNADLEGQMRIAAAKPEQPEVHLRPNKLVKYQHVAMVMATAQRLGLKKIGVIGNEQFI